MIRQEEAWLLKEKYRGERTPAFSADLERLKAGEPLAYVIGHIPFLGGQIYLDSKPLIPRPETEYWLEKAIEIMKAADQPLKVLDLCAGSGCIGIAVAKQVTGSKVDFAEIDQKHHETIAKNLKINGIEENRTKIIGGSLFENIQDQYDFILSNPPYIDPALDRAEDSVKRYEPSLALYGGQGGLELIEKIIAEAPKYLNQAGQLWIEHEPEQVAYIKAAAEAAHFYVTLQTDQFLVERVSVLSWL